MSAYVCWICDADWDTEAGVNSCCSHVRETITDLQSRLDSLEKENVDLVAAWNERGHRLNSAFHRLSLTDQESEDFEMAMRAVTEAREILIPSKRVVEKHESKMVVTEDDGPSGYTGSRSGGFKDPEGR